VEPRTLVKSMASDHVARERIVLNFGASGMVLQHEHLYESLLTKVCSKLAS
jgi:hypothetical protein